uniref:Uncharacterized protein n=1 Tax=viral metagenome TaxID=1070528 RepID=A0A6C0AG24_9ZZZZ
MKKNFNTYLFKMITDILFELKECASEYNFIISERKAELIKLDNYVWKEFVEIVNSREKMYITLNELSNVMKWKLSRGKFRPLQKLLDSNSPEEVVIFSTQAFEYMKNSESFAHKDWKKAIKSLMNLKAIGVATATAILAPFFPELVPFMSDEAMIFFNIKLNYTLKTYEELRMKLIEKANELNFKTNINWNAELVGKAIWVKFNKKSI